MSNTDKKSNANFEAALFGLSLDSSAGSSLQAQLTEALRAIILKDAHQTGARLPASRKLAGELSVSRTTVQSVYDQLISEGYLSTRRGSGTFVAEHLPHLTSPQVSAPQRPHIPEPWRPFQTGLPDQALLPQRLWARHLERAWRRPDPGLLARPDPFGWYPLRAAIAEHLLAWRGLPCQPAQVLITSGAWEAFELIFRGLIGPGTPVAVEDPGWPTLHDVLSATGNAARPVRIDAEGLCADQVPMGSAAVVVTPSRHYPTGTTMPLARRAALLNWAQSTGGLIIEDDYDSEFRYTGQPLPSLAGLDGLRHTAYMGSFSKLLSAALRIGYLVLPEAHLDAARCYLARVGPRASLVPQPALASFMSSGEFAVHLRRMRRVYARRQAHLVGELAGCAQWLELRPDPSGMHICAPLGPALKGRVTDVEIARRCREGGLSIRALSPQSVLPDPPQGLLLGYAGFGETELSDAARRLAGVLKGVAPG